MATLRDEKLSADQKTALEHLQAQINAVNAAAEEARDLDLYISFFVEGNSEENEVRAIHEL